MSRKLPPWAIDLLKVYQCFFFLSWSLSLAVAYECTRTITSIYPDKDLIGKAAKCVGVFLVAKSNDIKYLGKWFKCFSRLFLPSITGRQGDLMANALDSGASGPGSSTGRGHCVVFLGKTLYSHSASLHPGVYTDTGELLGKPSNLWGGGGGGVTCNGLASRPGEVRILLAASCYKNRDKLSSGSYEPALASRLHFTPSITHVYFEMNN